MEKLFDLQMFAEANVNVTTATVSGNNLAPEMKTFYDTELIEMATPNLVHAQFGVKRPIPQGRGKKVEWRKFSNFAKATTPLTEGVTPDGNKLDVSYIEKQVDQYGDYTTISDMLELTAIDDVVLEATDKHGSNAGLTLDTITRNELLTGTNVLYCPNGTTEVKSRADLTSKCVLTPDIVARAAAWLKANNAPKIDGSYVAIIHPYVAYDLMRSEEWIDVNKYSNAEKTIFEGEIGKLYGVRFVETSEAKIWKAEGKDATFATIFLGKGAYGTVDITGGGLEVIVKQKGSGGSADPLDQRSTVGFKATYAAKILIPEYIMRVESGSAFSATAEEN